ncbi:MAG: M66 family metalloprotease [Gemmatimonadetes bacterium]|nr:M66 family metalloprotease [Gemmatimonadota bacterium]
MRAAIWVPVRCFFIVGALLWAPACDDPVEPNRGPGTMGSIPAQSVFVADTVEILVSGYFSDPDGDALSYSAQSSDAAVVSAAASAGTVRVIGLKQGTATITVTGTDPGALSVEQSFTVTVPNRAPEAVDSIAAMETYVGESAHMVVAAYFSDPDGDSLSYTAESSDTGVVTATVSGDTVWVAGGAQGTTTVTVTATDPGGLFVTQNFPVTVPNRAPERVDSIPAVETHIGLSAPVVVPAYFRDPDGDSLSYTAESSDTGVVTATVSGDTVLVVAVAKGSATVTVTASDPGGLTARQSFAATVANRAPEAVDSIPALEKYLRETGAVVVSAYFTDPDGDALSYAVESSDTAVATAAVSGDTVRVLAVERGNANITVTASDPEGLFAEQSFPFTVPNRAPEVVDSIPAVDTHAGDQVTVIASAYFSDPDGDSLSYEAESSDTGIVTVSVSVESVRVVGVAEGSATVTVTASDPGGLSVAQAFPVKVSPDRQPAILEAFYEATGGASWTNNDNWLTDAPLDTWHGVEVNDRGRVISLELFRNNLKGTIPGELGGLASLETLDVRSNGLSGPIPPELGNLTNLVYAFMDSNELTGPIPPELGDLSRLKYLWLLGNSLSGPIPPEIGKLSGLSALSLSFNRLTGGIPPEMGDLHNIGSLDLSINRLTGGIPPELGDLHNLKTLRLGANQLTGGIPPELGDPQNLRTLDLSENLLTGSMPPQLGSLDSLSELRVEYNQLEGRLPAAFLELGKLRTFRFQFNTSLCFPRTSGFVAWRDNLRSVEGPWCGESDRKVLEELYEAASGADWENSGGWLVGDDLDTWYGVSADSFGYVVEIDLEDNGLKGKIPFQVGDLEGLTKLEIGTNDLVGPLPLRLTNLDLERFGYADTKLCELDDEEFEEWLDGIPSLERTGQECPDPREVLTALYHATGGSGWWYNENWLSDAPLDEWYGVETDEDGQVTWIELTNNLLVSRLPPELGDLPRLERLMLFDNYLSGPIPPELGKLSSLLTLDLSDNLLTGSIPPELGGLYNLSALHLFKNQLSGPIPSELGDLHELHGLHLFENQLSGSIPPELGRLSNLTDLSVVDNDLTGSIPPELGGLGSVEIFGLAHNRLSGAIPPELGDMATVHTLDLNDNDLSGPIPPELGDLPLLWRLDLSGNRISGPIPPELGDLPLLSKLHLNDNELSGPLPSELGDLSVLEELYLHGNPDLSGPIPSSFANLTSLTHFYAHDTGLCLPKELREWFIWTRYRKATLCHDADAYLVQSVQSLSEPVPLVADKEALLRVFVTAVEATTETLPPVTATFYVDDAESYKVDIDGTNEAIPTEISEESLAKSLNVVIPASKIEEGLELVIEIDPDSTIDHEILATTRIPESGRLYAGVKEVGSTELTFLPFLYTEDPDSSVIDAVQGMADDEEDHELLHPTYDLLPIGELVVKGHDPVEIDSDRILDVLSRTKAIRQAEGATDFWMGLMANPGGAATGAAYISGEVSASRLDATTMAHELGHNFSLRHAPCGGPRDVDREYPYEDGRIGAWGYDHRDEEVVRPSTKDLMSYCSPRWIGSYHFTAAANYRTMHRMEVRRGAERSLLVWGSRSASGELSMDPPLVVKGSPLLPDGSGDYDLTGRDDAGEELFSFSFDMIEPADAEEGTGLFVFLLPPAADWESLASLVLGGPGPGSFVLDADSEATMAMVRDLRTGQVRAVRGDFAEPPRVPPGHVVRWSRGIPDREAWRLR